MDRRTRLHHPEAAELLEALLEENVRSAPLRHPVALRRLQYRTVTRNEHNQNQRVLRIGSAQLPEVAIQTELRFVQP